jgi:outer membrane immunogenic protein
VGVLGLIGRTSARGASLCWLSLFIYAEASAADLYPPPGLKDGLPPLAPAIWQGFYLGGHAGGAWNNVDITDTYTYYGDPTAKNSAGGSGVIGGAQSGYNFQRRDIVYGVEADLGYLNLAGRKMAALQADPHNDAYWLTGNYTSSGNLYGDLTGRLGYAADRALLYVKGGAAFLNEDFKASYLGQNYTGIPHAFNFGRNEMLWG